MDSAGAVQMVMMNGEQYQQFHNKYSDESVVPPKPAGGAGTELKALLGMIGIKSSPTCSCNKRAKTMDENGIEWCKENVPTIISWLQEEAQKRRLPFSRLAARKLIQLSISKAERKAAKS